MSRAKQAAGRRAAEFVESGMTVGLGTGSTVFFTLERLAERIRDEGLELRGIATSVDTEVKARELGIALTSIDQVDRIALTIDGADEVDGQFQLIKGGGGALLREKVVASLTEREVIVIGRDKLVARLGLSFLLPVEVVPFARHPVALALRALGAQPTLRLADAEVPYRTDNGNEILDCRFPEGIAAPRELELDVLRIPGVVECGLFCDLTHTVVIGEADGMTEVLERPAI